VERLSAQRSDRTGQASTVEAVPSGGSEGAETGRVIRPSLPQREP